jgi:dUTP pyrophosphatase
MAPWKKSAPAFFRAFRPLPAALGYKARKTFCLLDFSEIFPKMRGFMTPRESGLTVLFKRLSPDPGWPRPAYGSAGASGMDLAAHLDQPLTLAPGQIQLVPTGWAMALPAGYEGQVRPRSGWALKKGLTVINTPGTIDWDYRGEISLALINLGPEPVVISRGDRVAQLVIQKVERLLAAEAAELDDTDRGAGGYGSTGS